VLWRRRVVVVAVAVVAAYGVTALGSLLISINIEKCVTKLTVY
jgi:hypothetical protein